MVLGVYGGVLGVTAEQHVLIFKKNQSELDQVKTDNRRSSAYVLKTAKSLIKFSLHTRLSQK